MAFNFNWSPLIADTDRVRDMLTTSLNKSPKPPIIVDDILVSSLNLGSTPPQLEILEIGDLAEDRFRGIFKMSYTGDAYLTLKTRVQANPLTTWLEGKPDWVSGRSGLGAGAARGGLTIPLQITLSDIRLSGFVILVFSRQKGITLVFRNDPLESLKVSSTFDSIPFVRDYLQRTIERQIRVLFMEDLPAIIHRLSLRMCGPEYQVADSDGQVRRDDDGQVPIDPFASPAQQAVDGDSDAPFLTLDTTTETYASFSQKNLLRLAALSESQRTLSLFTPSIRDTVYRAWASSATERSNENRPSMQRPTLSRIQSTLAQTLATPSNYTASTTSGASDAPSIATRPTLASFQSAPTVYTLGSARSRPHTGRKRKNRIVNLRKDRGDGSQSDMASVSSGYPDSAEDGTSTGPSRSGGGSARCPVVPDIGQASSREGEVATPPRSPRKRVTLQDDRPAPPEGGRLGVETDRRPVTPQGRHVSHSQRLQVRSDDDDDRTPRASMMLPPVASEPSADQDPPHTATIRPRRQRLQRQPLSRMQTVPSRPAAPALSRTSSDLSLRNLPASWGVDPGISGGILEQAWMMKMAAEIANRVVEEKQAKSTGWQEREDGEQGPPPAYGL